MLCDVWWICPLTAGQWRVRGHTFSQYHQWRSIQNTYRFCVPRASPATRIYVMNPITAESEQHKHMHIINSPWLYTFPWICNNSICIVKLHITHQTSWTETYGLESYRECTGQGRWYQTAGRLECPADISPPSSTESRTLHKHSSRHQSMKEEKHLWSPQDLCAKYNFFDGPWS